MPHANIPGPSDSSFPDDLCDLPRRLFQLGARMRRHESRPQAGAAPGDGRIADGGKEDTLLVEALRHRHRPAFIADDDGNDGRSAGRFDPRFLKGLTKEPGVSPEPRHPLRFFF